jgi:transcriptional regulator with XRE-family HTH domain
MAAHPIDQEIRERLRKLVSAPTSTTAARLRQIELATRIGRSPAWVNKYVNGVGNATVDDVIRIVAIVIGVDAPRLTDDEQALLRAWRRVEEKDQPDLLRWVQNLGRRPRRAARSDARSGQTTRGANSKGPGKP